MINRAKIIAGCLLAPFILFALARPATSAGIDDNSIPPLLFHTKQARPVELKHHDLTLQEAIERCPVASQYMQPIPLKGVVISGLLPKSVEALGNNYFIVVDNTKYMRMADIYREARLSGKSIFVTADSIIHPYLAFTNRLLAEVVLSRMIPDLQALLQAMEKVAEADYRQADDAEVRNDAKCNLAFLSVALRLLDAHYQIPRVGNVPELA